MFVLLLDPRDLPMARALGVEVQLAPEPDGATLRAARAVVLSRDDAGPRLRGWRMAGVFTPAIVHQMPAGDRAWFEPVAVLRGPHPSSLEEALLSLAPVDAPLSFGAPRGRVDLGRRRVIGPGVDEPLSKLEADLLAYLFRRAGRDVPRDELLVQVWGHKRAGETRSVDMAISRLRKKLELEPSAPATLLTARGGGYRLVPVDPLRAPPTWAPPSDSFVGRRDILEQLTADALLADRVTALTGPRGAGKSRLAREIASRTRDRWPGGVIRCDLSGCADTSAAVLAVSASLQVQPEPRATPFDVLAAIGRLAAVRPATLIILDDGDGVPGAVAALAEAITGAGQCAVLLPQRTPSPVARRQVDVPPLPAADADHLRRDRAAALGLSLPAHAPGPALPLTAEVAAGLPLPHSADEGALSETIQAALAAMSPTARAALAELTVFQGGFTRTAAGSVVSDRRNLDAALLELAGWSVLQPAEGGRHRVSGAFREELDKIEALPAGVQVRHAAWAAAWAEQITPQLDTFDGQGAYASLQAEASNLAAAFETALRACPEHAPALGRALAALHTAHGSTHDAAALGERVRDASYPRGGRARVEGLLLYAEVLHRFDVARALEPYEEAAETAESLGEARLMALARYGCGNAAQWRIGPLAALAPTRIALEAARRARDLSLEADIENQLAFLEGQVGVSPREAVIRRMQASRESMLQAGQLRSVFLATVRLAHTLHNAGHDDVSANARRQLALWARHLPSRRFQRIAWVEAGISHALEGRHHEALTFFRQAVEDAERHGDPPGPTLVYHRGCAQLDLGELDAAARDFAWAEALAAAGGRHPDQAHAREGLALVDLEAGRLDDALRHAEVGIELASHTGDTLLTGYLHAHRALALHLAGDPAAALAIYATLGGPHQGMLGPAVLGRAAAAHLARGERTAAADSLDQLRRLPYRTIDRVACTRLLELALEGGADLGPWTGPPHGHEVRLLARALTTR